MQPTATGTFSSRGSHGASQATPCPCGWVREASDPRTYPPIPNPLLGRAFAAAAWLPEPNWKIRRDARTHPQPRRERRHDGLPAPGGGGPDPVCDRRAAQRRQVQPDEHARGAAGVDRGPHRRCDAGPAVDRGRDPAGGRHRQHARAGDRRHRRLRDRRPRRPRGRGGAADRRGARRVRRSAVRHRRGRRRDAARRAGRPGAPRERRGAAQPKDKPAGSRPSRSSSSPTRWTRPRRPPRAGRR